MARAFIIGLLFACVAAHADKEQSMEHYRKGKKLYNISEFGQSIRQFKLAYKEAPHPVYLYNIAQAYRQLGDCRNAKFFYDQYLSEDDKRTYGKLAEKHLKELGDCSAYKFDNTVDKPPIGAPEELSKISPMSVGIGMGGYGSTVICTCGNSQTDLPASLQFGLRGAFTVLDRKTWGLGIALFNTTKTFTYSDPAGSGRLYRVGVTLGPELRFSLYDDWQLAAGVGAGLDLLLAPGTGNPLTEGGESHSSVAMFFINQWLNLSYRLKDPLWVTVSGGADIAVGSSAYEDDIDALIDYGVRAGITLNF